MKLLYHELTGREAFLCLDYKIKENKITMQNTSKALAESSNTNQFKERLFAIRFLRDNPELFVKTGCR